MRKNSKILYIRTFLIYLLSKNVILIKDEKKGVFYNLKSSYQETRQERKKEKFMNHKMKKALAATLAVMMAIPTMGYGEIPNVKAAEATCKITGFNVSDEPITVNVGDNVDEVEALLPTKINVNRELVFENADTTDATDTTDTTNTTNSADTLDDADTVNSSNTNNDVENKNEPTTDTSNDTTKTQETTDDVNSDKTENADVVKAEDKKENVESDLTTSETPTESKDEVKDEIKDEIKDEVKDDVKEEVKEETKEEPKEEVKEDSEETIVASILSTFKNIFTNVVPQPMVAYAMEDTTTVDVTWNEINGKALDTAIEDSFVFEAVLGTTDADGHNVVLDDGVSLPKMVINVVDPNKPVVKKIPQLAFKKTEATMFLGSTGKMNELNGVPDGATVTWDADSKYDIAEIDQSGNITPNATGDVLVTAYTSETDEYQVGHISYKLHIISVNGTYTVDKSEWSDSRYTITSNAGYKLREIDNPVNTDALSVDVNDGEEKEDTYQFLVVNEATGAVSAPQSITYKIDKKAPTATIRCSNKTWSEYSYGKIEPTLSPTGTVVVKIDAIDNGSGVKSIKYGITPYLYGKNQVDLMVNVHDDGPENGWHTYNQATGIVLKPNSQNVVYAKITDNVGHETIICSTTIVTYNAGDMNYPDGDSGNKKEVKATIDITDITKSTANIKVVGEFNSEVKDYYMVYTPLDDSLTFKDISDFGWKNKTGLFSASGLSSGLTYYVYAVVVDKDGNQSAVVKKSFSVPTNDTVINPSNGSTTPTVPATPTTPGSTNLPNNGNNGNGGNGGNTNINNTTNNTTNNITNNGGGSKKKHHHSSSSSNDNTVATTTASTASTTTDTTQTTPNTTTLNSVPTGDTNNLALYGGIAGVSILAIAVLFFLKKKNK